MAKSGKPKKIFISYAHDKNAKIVNQIKDYLVDAGYDVWIDKSQIHTGEDWRRRITDGLLESNGVIAFLSKHAVRRPDGVCLDELHIAQGVKHNDILTILMETEGEVEPPASLCDHQWMDMSDWENKINLSDWDLYFKSKMTDLISAIESDESNKFQGEIETLRDILEPLDNDSKAERLLKQAFVGREWLIKKIHVWLDSDKRDNKATIIYGKPGAGKSAFVANMLHYDPDVLTDIFFEWDSNYLQDVDNVIRTLAFRLSVVLPDYRKMLCNLCYDENKGDRDPFKKYKGYDLMNVLITDPLNHCIDGGRANKIIVIDGLDEANEKVIDMLVKLCILLPGWLKVLFTARDVERVRAKFANVNQIFIDDDCKANVEDVEKYLQQQLEDNEEMIHSIAEISEGNFQYAVLLCDSVKHGEIQPQDIRNVPNGISDFYTMQFERLYPDYENFKADRSIWEMILIEPAVPLELICRCLDINEYELIDFQNRVGGTILIQNKEKLAFGKQKYSKLEFTHRSLADWMTDYNLSGKYYVNPDSGERRLATWNYISSKDDHEVQLDAELYNFAKTKRAHWLYTAKTWEELEQLLLTSYNRESLNEFFDDKNCVNFSILNDNLLCNWEFADVFPKSYPMDKIKKKLIEIINSFGFQEDLKNWDWEHFVRDFYATYALLNVCVKRETFADVFFSTFDGFRIDEFFNSQASDEADTRDGYDKLWISRWIWSIYCRCKRNGINIPENVEIICNGIKQLYPSEGTFSINDQGNY